MKFRILLSILLVSLMGCSTTPRTSSKQPTVAPSIMPTSTSTQTPTQTPTPPAGYEALIGIFSYDASVPLDVTWGTDHPMEGAHVQDVSYQGTEHCQGKALPVQPEGDGSYPAVIYMHRVPENRSQFLNEAIELAGQGVISLLLDSPFDLRCYPLEADALQGYIDAVIFIRRGIDFLNSLPQVDSTHLAYVGHSFGANLGGVVAGVDPRIHSFVLMAGVANLSNYNSPVIRDVDAYQYISHADDDVFLFQFGTSDEFITKAAASLYYGAASGEKSMLWYETDHQGVQEVGRADRVTWLLRQLGVGGD